jgi:hypothetical protein
VTDVLGIPHAPDDLGYCACWDCPKWDGAQWWQPQREAVLDILWALRIDKLDDGTFVLVGDAPDRLHLSREYLDCTNPAVEQVDDQGGLTFTLTNATLRYRRVAVHDLHIEFERVG